MNSNSKKKLLNNKPGHEDKSTDQIKQLFDQIEECETASDFDRGFEIVQEILKLDASNVQALLTGASCLVNRNSEKDDLMAKEWYVKAIELEPNKGYGKYFAYAQLVEGNDSIELYNKGLSILEEELLGNKNNLSQDDLIKLKADKVDALRSQVEVYLADLSDDQTFLLKARQVSMGLLKDENFTPQDIFLLAQIYDKLGQKYKSEIKELCSAAARRILCFPPHKEQDADMASIFISKMSKFCLDYGFINITNKLLHRLRDVGGETLDYFSLKALYYRVKCNDAMKNAHVFANSCLEELEVMEAEGELNDDDAIDEIKETMNEIKNKTPLQLPKLFGDVETTSDNQEEENDGEDEYAEFSDEEDVFPLTTNMKTIQKTRKFKNIFDREEKRILTLCLSDLEANDMEIE